MLRITCAFENPLSKNTHYCICITQPEKSNMFGFKVIPIDNDADTVAQKLKALRDIATFDEDKCFDCVGEAWDAALLDQAMKYVRLNNLNVRLNDLKFLTISFNNFNYIAISLIESKRKINWIDGPIFEYPPKEKEYVYKLLVHTSTKTHPKTISANSLEDGIKKSIKFFFN